MSVRYIGRSHLPPMGDVGTFRNIEHHIGIQLEVEGDFSTHMVKIPFGGKDSPSPWTMLSPGHQMHYTVLITDLITCVCLTIGLLGFYSKYRIFSPLS